MQASIWEWDDVVFGVALSNFAPQAQVPQAPFYPGFVYLGRAAKLLLSDPVLSLTAVSAAASCLAVLLVFLYGLELLGRPREALSAALIFAFLPAVWFHAGVPLSDPAGLAAALAACWLALKARRKPRLLDVAAVAFGIAVSIRPQTALVALFPLGYSLVAASPKARRRGVVLGIVSVLSLYVAPILLAGGLSGPARFFGYQSSYVLGTDSLLAPWRSVRAVLAKYLIDIWGTPWLAVVIVVLVGYGVVCLASRERAKLLELGATFLPYGLLCWLALDPKVGGRYALPYLPMVALLAGVAIVELEQKLVPWRAPILTGCLILGAALVMWPAVDLVHTSPSPPVAAARAIRRAAAGSPFGVIYRPSLYPQAQWLFPDVPKFKDSSLRGQALQLPPGRSWWRYGVPGSQHPSVAAWPALPAFTWVGRGRYLRVPYGPVSLSPMSFGKGWYAPETTTLSDGATVKFRWMEKRAEVQFPAFTATAHLVLSVRAPLFALPAAPEIGVMINGQQIDRLVGQRRFTTVSVGVPAALLRMDRPNVAEITTNLTFIPHRVDPRSNDRRVLGLEVSELILVLN